MADEDEGVGVADPPVDRAERAKKIQEFYLNLIDTGEEYPLEEWKRARRQYAGGKEEADQEWANLFRGQVDTLKAFLDQGWTAMRFLPAEGRDKEPDVQGQAACDTALAQYFKRELALEGEALRALQSCLIVNAGCVVRKWDLARMIPSIQEIKPEQVRWDSNCGGNPRRAGWVAYVEFVSPEMLHRETGIPVRTLRDAARKTKPPREEEASGETTLVETSARKLQAQGKCRATLDRCRVWNFFGRNEYALYDEAPDDMPGLSSQAEQSILEEDPDAEREPEKGPHLERFLDAQGLREPRRFVRIVEGLDDRGPIADEDDWPKELALDTDEWPVIWIAFNDDGETVASFPDYRHTNKGNKAFESALGDFAWRMRFQLAMRWLLSRSLGKNRDEIERALKDFETATIPDALDDQGRPLVKQADLADFPPVILEALKVWREVTDIASMQNEILRGGEGTFNTAFEARMSREASTVKVSNRLRAYEAFVAEIHRGLLAMAHVMMPLGTAVEMFVFDPKTNEVLELIPKENLRWAEVRRLMLESPGTEITELGVEAIVGPELARFWKPKQPLEIIRRDLRVMLEEGGTQRSARLEQGAVLKELAAEVLLPLYQQANRPDLVVEAVRRILTAAGIAEADALLPKPEDFIAAAVPTLPQVGAGGPGAPAGAETLAGGAGRPVAEEPVPVETV